MIDLDRALTELADRLDVPDDDRVVDAVMRRIAATQPHRSRRRRLVAGIATVGIVVAGVSPGPRGAIARWLGFDSVRIEPGVTVPTTATTAPATTSAPGTSVAPATTSPLTTVALGLGTSMTIGAAQAASGLPDPTPAVLGPPESVHVVHPPHTGQIVLVYPASALLPPSPVTGVGALVSVLPAHIEEGFFGKALGQDATVQSVQVAGSAGYWIEGSPHQLLFQTADGMDFDSLRLATNTLVWERGNVVFRVEADVTLNVAVRIAESIRS